MTDHVVSDVCNHLHLIEVNPKSPLDEILLCKIDERKAETLGDHDRIQILGAVQTLLPTLQQDAKPVTSLVIRLLGPHSVKFEQVDVLLTQDGRSNDQYITGLESRDKDVNLLMLDLLSKASSSASGIGLLAGRVDVVRAWVRLWLVTPDTSVAEKAAEVLECFVMAGIETDQATAESNLMVRRLFRDRDIYESLFSLCSLRTLGGRGQPDKGQKTIAQARLLEFLIKIDHAMSPIRTSQFPDVEQLYGVTDLKGGLLYFAFTHMLDHKYDVLLLSCLFQSCTRYLVRRCPGSNERSDYALAFLKANDLHRTCLSYFLESESCTHSWLINDAILYLESYCSVWRDDMMKDEQLCQTILEKLTRQFQNATKADWHSNTALGFSLMALKSLPKTLHLRNVSNDTSPLLLVPANTSNTRVIDVFTGIFCTVDAHLHFKGEAADTIHQTDRMTARVLYIFYIRKYPQLWTHMVQLASTVALAETALSAIRFIDSFVNVEWALVDKNVVPSLPSETELSQMLGDFELPCTGMEVLLYERNVTTVLLPFLLKSQIRGHPTRQASERFNSGEDILKAFQNASAQLTSHIIERLKKLDIDPDLKEALDGFTRRVDASRRAQMSQGVGESVATMRR